mmetsp:Transcript_20378/g.56781  ORF Transcript_20378/g.56781 Transcript_20378/m.56781 type:complete len:239 (-) Transcript_20378:2402-3118(-)
MHSAAPGSLPCLLPRAEMSMAGILFSASLRAMASDRARHCTVSAAGSSMKGHAEVEEEMMYLPSLQASRITRCMRSAMSNDSRSPTARMAQESRSRVVALPPSFRLLLSTPPSTATLLSLSTEDPALAWEKRAPTSSPATKPRVHKARSCRTSYCAPSPQGGSISTLSMRATHPACLRAGCMASERARLNWRDTSRLSRRFSFSMRAKLDSAPMSLSRIRASATSLTSSLNSSRAPVS